MVHQYPLTVVSNVSPKLFTSTELRTSGQSTVMHRRTPSSNFSEDLPGTAQSEHREDSVYEDMTRAQKW